jgi:hypothetical protein
MVGTRAALVRFQELEGKVPEKWRFNMLRHYATVAVEVINQCPPTMRDLAETYFQQGLSNEREPVEWPN